MARFRLPIGRATALRLAAVFLAACGGGGGDDPGGDELPTPTVRWTSLNASHPPGLSAVCVVERARSDAQRTVFTIEIPDFWMKDKEGPDGRT